MEARWGSAALAGLVVWWVAGAVAPAQTDLAAIGRVLDLFLLVLTPLVLGLDPRQRPTALALPAAVLAAASGLTVLWELALVWLVFALVVVREHPARWLRGERTPAVALDAAARVFLVVGAGWVVIDRARVALPGLVPEQIRLAAIHSHFIGFGVLALAAASARRRAGADQDARPLLAVGVALTVAFLLIANGIAFAHALEPIGAALLALALAGWVALDLSGPRPEARLARALRLLSLAALAAALALAINHSLRALPGVSQLARGQLISLHGWTIALGFLLPAVLAQALAARGAALARGGQPLLLFDGQCGLCDKTVQTLLRLDPDGDLRFAPLQGETADPILARAGITQRDDFDSILLVRDPGGPREEIRTEFAGALAVLGSLRAARYRGLGRLLRLVPAWLGDAGYRLVARHRLRIWGTVDACRIPTPAERARVLP